MGNATGKATESFAEALIDVLLELETRIAYLEYRLKLEGIKDLPDGIPDDEMEAGQYFAMDLEPLQGAMWRLEDAEAFAARAVRHLIARAAGRAVDWKPSWDERPKVRVDAMAADDIWGGER